MKQHVKFHKLPAFLETKYRKIFLRSLFLNMNAVISCTVSPLVSEVNKGNPHETRLFFEHVTYCDCEVGGA